jgi:hypothetical protein
VRFVLTNDLVTASRPRAGALATALRGADPMSEDFAGLTVADRDRPGPGPLGPLRALAEGEVLAMAMAMAVPMPADTSVRCLPTIGSRS